MVPVIVKPCIVNPSSMHYDLVPSTYISRVSDFVVIYVNPSIKVHFSSIDTYEYQTLYSEGS